MLLDFDAIIFDLDGTLVDSTAVVGRHWRLWANRNGVNGEDIMAIAHGRPAVEIIGQVAPHLDAAAEAKQLEFEEAQDTDGILVIDGAAALLASLPTETWGIATSATRQMAAVRLQHTDLPIPYVFITADDVVNGKPHPEPFLKASEQLGVLPETCVVFEDSPAGLESARAAGMTAVAVASTFSPDYLASLADYTVPDLTQVQFVGENGRLRLQIDG